MQAPQLVTQGDLTVSIFKTGRWLENAYLIRHNGTGEMIMIDPGDHPDEMVAHIRSESHSGQLLYVLLTHAHHDHLGALNAICKTFEVPFFLHAADVKLLKRAPLYAMTFEKKQIDPPVGHQILDGRDFSLGGRPIRITHIPGHTQGGVCYHLDGFAFTGDTLLVKQVGRTDLPGSDRELLKRSVDQLLTSLPGDTLIFPGHGSPWSVSEARAWWEQARSRPPEYTEE